MPSEVTSITYFGLHGRRSAILFQLAHAGVEVEINSLTMEQWAPLKPKYGGLPFVVLKDGTELTEAQPISRMIALENGQYPTDPLQGYENDRIMNIYYDLFNACAGPYLSGENAKI